MSDLSKLPKWAQSKIATLQADLDRAHRLLDEVHGNADTNTTMVDFGVDKEFGLLNNARIRFAFASNRYVDCRIIDGRLDVCGMGPLAITPSASNRIMIAVE